MKLCQVPLINPIFIDKLTLQLLTNIPLASSSAPGGFDKPVGPSRGYTQSLGDCKMLRCEPYTVSGSLDRVQ